MHPRFSGGTKCNTEPGQAIGASCGEMVRWCVDRPRGSRNSGERRGTHLCLPHHLPCCVWIILLLRVVRVTFREQRCLRRGVHNVREWDDFRDAPPCLPAQPTPPAAPASSVTNTESELLLAGAPRPNSLLSPHTLPPNSQSRKRLTPILHPDAVWDCVRHPGFGGRTFSLVSRVSRGAAVEASGVVAAGVLRLLRRCVGIGTQSSASSSDTACSGDPPEAMVAGICCDAGRTHESSFAEDQKRGGSTQDERVRKGI